MFQQYPQKDVNEPVLLHEGRFRVRAGDPCIEPSGSAHLRWLPSPGIEFDIETDVPLPDIETIAIATSVVVAAYVSGSPSGSLK